MAPLSGSLWGVALSAVTGAVGTYSVANDLTRIGLLSVATVPFGAALGWYVGMSAAIVGVEHRVLTTIRDHKDSFVRRDWKGPPPEVPDPRTEAYGHAWTPPTDMDEKARKYFEERGPSM
jgi:hypothetical protein